MTEIRSYLALILFFLLPVHDEEFPAPGSGKISCILRRGILPLYIKCGAQSHAVYSVIENIT